MTRVGELGGEVAIMINDLDSTKEGVEEDKKFLAGMDRICELKRKEWAEYQKMTAIEMLTLADTLKIPKDTLKNTWAKSDAERQLRSTSTRYPGWTTGLRTRAQVNLLRAVPCAGARL